VADPGALERGRTELGLSLPDLWMRYFTLGGMATAMEVEAVLCGALVGQAHDLQLLAVALNERYAEIGGDHPIPYAGDPPRPPPPGGAGAEPLPGDG
jgi:hypothetical protein